MKIVVVADADGTLTTEDTLFNFFGSFGKRKRAKEVNRARPSKDVELVLEEIILERGKIPLDAFEKVGESAKLANGAEEFAAGCRKAGGVFVITCTYSPIARKIAGRLGISSENVFSTQVETAGGFVTGFLGPIMDGAEKKNALLEITDRIGLPLSCFVGLGDSASDAPFIRAIVEAGGLGLAVKRQDKLQKAGAWFVDGLDEAFVEIEKFAEELK